MEVTVKGLKVYYTVEGCGAEDVLILEGWGTNTQVYRPISAQLSQKYHVFTPDLPGFGKSEEPKENWTVGDYAAFVKEFAGKVGIQKVTLIGHSFGGRIILKLHENPSELPFETERIVLIDSAGIRPADTLRKRLRRLKYKVGRRFLEVFRKDRVETYRLRHSSADYKAASPRMREVLKNTVSEDLGHLLPKLRAPTLLIWGRNDTATPLADGQRMEKEIPDAGLVVLEGGHYSFLDSPEVFRRVMASFLKL